MTNRGWMQHGDVTLTPAIIPAQATLSNRRTLAEGEVTGHAHRLLENADCEVYEFEGTLFLRVGSRGADLTHEEHGVGTIAPGDYQVGRVLEYDHFTEEARAVRD